MDIERIKANGPWVLIKPEKPKNRTVSGLYIPEGNLMERLGHSVGRVLSVGKGYFEKVGDKEKLIRPAVKKGDRVIFRGHLQNAIRVCETYCFIHMKDLVGTLGEGEELDLALPYDN